MAVQDQETNADLQLEVALLAEALRKHDRYLARGVVPADYCSPKHQAVAEALQSAWEAGAPITVDSVALELQRAGKLDLAGGYRGVAELASGSPAVPDTDRLKELARLRALSAAAYEVLRHAQSGRLHEALAALGDAQVDVLSSIRGNTRTAADLGEVVLTDLMQSHSTRRTHPGITAFADKVGMLPNGSMTVVGGDTNVSKSGFALEMMYCMCQRQVVCGMVSVEDPDDVTGSRVLAYASNVSSRDIQRGKLHADQFGALSAGIERLKSFGGRMLFEDCTGGNELDVCAAMTRMASRGARVVIVDYIQEIDCSKKQQDRRNELRWLTKRLKAHAKRLKIALVCISQLARPRDGETGKKPTKHQLKESGDISNQAEVILLLWRAEEDDAAPVRVEVAKVKWGGVGQYWEMRRRPELGGRLCADEDYRV